MMLTSRPSSPASPTPHDAAQKLSQFQADLVSTVRMCGVDEVDAAMAHRLSEPLTALLLYLHEIKDSSERARGTESMREMVERALCETERVCDIVERMDRSSKLPTHAELVVARGCGGIDSWTRGTNARGNGHALPEPVYSGHDRLTPREWEVLNLITGGATNREGGSCLGISIRTFEVHRAHIMSKLGAKNAADLVRISLGKAREVKP